MVAQVGDDLGCRALVVEQDRRRVEPWRHAVDLHHCHPRTAHLLERSAVVRRRDDDEPVRPHLRDPLEQVGLDRLVLVARGDHHPVAGPRQSLLGVLGELGEERVADIGHDE